MATNQASLGSIDRIAPGGVALLPIYLETAGQRRALLSLTSATSGVRRETATKIILRALAREVARCRAELAHGSVNQRMTAGDQAEEELLKLFAGEDLGLL